MPSVQIVVIEQRLAAGVRRKGIQGVLRGLEIIRSGQRRSPVVHADAAWRAMRCVPQRGRRHKAARIDREHHHVGANRRVDGGLHLRLIVDAVETHSAGEVDEATFFSFSEPSILTAV